MLKSYKVKKNNQLQKGFSLIELLLVVTIVGIISTIAVPFLIKAVDASENSNAFASLRSIASVQVSYFSRNNRFGRLGELNAEANNALGTMDGSNLRRGIFTLTMSPVNPTDDELTHEFEIVATKGATVSGDPCVLSLNSTGYITEIFGTNCVND